MGTPNPSNLLGLTLFYKNTADKNHYVQMLQIFMNRLRIMMRLIHPK